MPTPFGHAVAGLAAALAANSVPRRPGLPPGLFLAAAAVAMAPDLDLLVGSHRTVTHSIGALPFVAVASWLVMRRRPDALAAAGALAAAYASHPVLDWMGKDTSRPPGLTILWPFSDAFFISGWNMFGEVSRRYWLVDEFVFGNIVALLTELMIFGPALLIAWIVWSGRTIKH
jgi:membrane-bound metal-dependent hydrolase YbcI (DUF457 family)